MAKPKRAACARRAKACVMHDEMVAALQRFVGIRKPNVPWTRAQTERSLAALEAHARALLAQAGES